MSAHASHGHGAGSFVDRIQRLAGQELLACYQCGKCSAGCPMAKYMDILPNQMIRLAQLGCEKELLGAEAPWLCVSCLTCNSRCPKGVRIAETFEAVRQLQLRRRMDHAPVRDRGQTSGDAVPPIALIGSMRKLTS